MGKQRLYTIQKEGVFDGYLAKSSRCYLYNHDLEKEKQVREYLTKEKAMHRYVGLSTFETISAAPVSSLENLKLALGYIWLDLDVHIDWSRPTEEI